MGYKTFFSRLYYYIKPHLVKVIVTIVSVIIASLLTAALPEITGRMVDELFTDQSNQGQATFYALLLLGITLLTALFTLIHTASNSWVSNQVIASIRGDMFAKLLALPKSYFDQNTSGNLLSKLTFDVEQISQAASTIWVDFARSSVMVVSLVSYLFYKNWQLSLLLLALIPLIGLSIKASAIQMRKANQKVQDSMGEMTQSLGENIDGNSLIKIYQAQEYEQNKFIELSKRIRQQRFKVDVSNAANASIASIGIGASLSLVVYLSSTAFEMTAGEFMAFFTAMGILVKPAKELIGINKPLQLALTAANSVFTLIDSQAENNTGSQKPSPIQGSVVFNQVSFSYNDQNPVLKNISFEVGAGQTVALVGATGSGKSTIIDLLCRFYQPNAGSITLNGVDIADFDLVYLRAQISWVDQSVRLFNDSIANNIALGKTNSLSADVIKSAANTACATEFISQLADGFNSQIGNNGSKLSGGQRQRLAIARAIAKNTPILIFDEATAALDNTTEQQLQQSLKALKGKQSMIIIAHRLSTVQQADKIIVLDGGSVVEQGTHQTLIANSGVYNKLYQYLT